MNFSLRIVAFPGLKLQFSGIDPHTPSQQLVAFTKAAIRRHADAAATAIERGELRKRAGSIDTNVAMVVASDGVDMQVIPLGNSGGGAARVPVHAAFAALDNGVSCGDCGWLYFAHSRQTVKIVLKGHLWTRGAASAVAVSSSSFAGGGGGGGGRGGRVISVAAADLALCSVGELKAMVAAKMGLVPTDIVLSLPPAPVSSEDDGGEADDDFFAGADGDQSRALFDEQPLFPLLRRTGEVLLFASRHEGLTVEVATADGLGRLTLTRFVRDAKISDVMRRLAQSFGITCAGLAPLAEAERGSLLPESGNSSASVRGPRRALGGEDVLVGHLFDPELSLADIASALGGHVRLRIVPLLSMPSGKGPSGRREDNEQLTQVKGASLMHAPTATAERMVGSSGSGRRLEGDIRVVSTRSVHFEPSTSLLQKDAAIAMIPGATGAAEAVPTWSRVGGGGGGGGGAVRVPAAGEASTRSDDAQPVITVVVSVKQQQRGSGGGGTALANASLIASSVRYLLPPAQSFTADDLVATLRRDNVLSSSSSSSLSSMPAAVKVFHGRQPLDGATVLQRLVPVSHRVADVTVLLSVVEFTSG